MKRRRHNSSIVRHTLVRFKLFANDEMQEELLIEGPLYPSRGITQNRTAVRFAAS